MKEVPKNPTEASTFHKPTPRQRVGELKEVANKLRLPMHVVFAEDGASATIGKPLPEGSVLRDENESTRSEEQGKKEDKRKD